MNERFFNLKQDKQDRMINAALKVFALNGYKRACTDEIVKEAQISKGLLFHYFVSKAGLYEFIYDYSTRYMKLELSGIVSQEDNGFWERCQSIEAVKAQLMRKYPYMQMFLDVAGEETDQTVGEEMREKQEEYAEFVQSLYLSPEQCAQPISGNYELFMRLRQYAQRGAMERALKGPEADSSGYYSEISSIFQLMGELSEREAMIEEEEQEI